MSSSLSSLLGVRWLLGPMGKVLILLILSSQVKGCTDLSPWPSLTGKSYNEEEFMLAASLARPPMWKTSPVIHKDMEDGR